MYPVLLYRILWYVWFIWYVWAFIICLVCIVCFGIYGNFGFHGTFGLYGKFYVFIDKARSEESIVFPLTRPFIHKKEKRLQQEYMCVDFVTPVF